ncbi:MAG: hypothetical protein AB7E47_14010 [Desulfovibrionaceae bacterium]
MTPGARLLAALPVALLTVAVLCAGGCLCPDRIYITSEDGVAVPGVEGIWHEVGGRGRLEITRVDDGWPRYDAYIPTSCAHYWCPSVDGYAMPLFGGFYVVQEQEYSEHQVVLVHVAADRISILGKRAAMEKYQAFVRSFGIPEGRFSQEDCDTPFVDRDEFIRFMTGLAKWFGDLSPKEWGIFTRTGVDLGEPDGRP